jgi:hypothetical protein
MFNQVSMSGTAGLLVQIGSGSLSTSGYVSSGGTYNSASATNGGSSTAGFYMYALAASITNGMMVLCLQNANVWVSSHACAMATNQWLHGAGVSPTLAGTLDQVRITSTNGTDTFDAGSINIIYE